MKAVWFNSVGEVFDIMEDTDFPDMMEKWNVVASGDKIVFVDDEDETYKVGGRYDEMRRI